ncbi:MAG: hypoxanthine phosphoribosyltransferase [Acidobacteria bacterium]|nr:hypoxanthine phosphoribosyltransferase [Acidobacteriota bacterium]MBI3656111.1 hypoxanthine phosphoribosyltransferase [Acidobacteriota bacterium]
MQHTQVISTAALTCKVAELADQITKDYCSHPVTVIGVLKQSFIFMADLVRVLEIPMTCQFVKVFTENNLLTQEITFVSQFDITDRNLLLVYGVMGTGVPSAYLVSHLLDRRPASLKICTLIDKPMMRRSDIRPDYIGFSVESDYLVGYGLDYMDRYAHLPYLARLQMHS